MTDCTHFQILNFTGPIPGVDRRRWWVRMGDSLTLADDVALTVLRERQQRSDGYVLRFEVFAGGRCHGERVLRPGEALDLSHWLAVLVLPRALRLARGRPAAVLLEVLRMPHAAQWSADWVTSDPIY